MTDLAENAVTLLSTTTVALNANAATTLYVVPVGKRCVLSHATLVVGANAADTVTISIGQDGALEDFVVDTGLSDLDAQYDATTLVPLQDITDVFKATVIKSYPAAEIIQANVLLQAGGGATNTLYLFGWLYDA